MEFSSITPVILGALNFGPHSGYEIKALVDHSTRFFWAASYGQIYPELKRLEANGLVESESAPRGGRRRSVYRITPAGREALVDYLTSASLSYELRDEGLLKLFFAGALDEEAAIELVRAIGRRHLAAVDELRAIEPLARQGGGFPYLVLETGIELHSQMAATYADLERRLAAQKEKN